MDGLVTLVQFAAIALGLGWLFVLLATPRKTALHLVWGLFCGSLCLMLVNSAMADSLGTRMGRNIHPPPLSKISICGQPSISASVRCPE
jgi:hypothetical protein